MTNVVGISRRAVQISTHTPLARRDLCTSYSLKFIDISTHTPLARRDSAGSKPLPATALFLLTRLLRGVTKPMVLFAFGFSFLLTRLLRGVTLDPYISGIWSNISTHTPLARRDAAPCLSAHFARYFYSHASREA